MEVRNASAVLAFSGAKVRLAPLLLSCRDATALGFLAIMDLVGDSIPDAQPT